jgi:hypothetical protein
MNEFIELWAYSSPVLWAIIGLLAIFLSLLVRWHFLKVRNEKFFTFARNLHNVVTMVGGPTDPLLANAAAEAMAITHGLGPPDEMSRRLQTASILYRCVEKVSVFKDLQEIAKHPVSPRMKTQVEEALRHAEAVESEEDAAKLIEIYDQEILAQALLRLELLICLPQRYFIHRLAQQHMWASKRVA